MSDCSSSSVGSSVSHSRSYKCGACGGIGHNRRSCSSVSKTVLARKSKEPDPPVLRVVEAPKAWKGVPDDEEIDLLSFVPVSEPAPKPLPPSPPSSVVGKSKPNELGFVLTRKAKHASPHFLLLRTLYNHFPEQFSIHISPHASKHEAEEHITILHSYTYFVADEVERTAYAYYHAYFRTISTPQGTKKVWTRFTGIDAYKKMVILAEFSAPL